MKAGLQNVYGIAGVGANLKGIRLSYGGGLRIPLENNRDHINVEYITGSNPWIPAICRLFANV